jgi:hypothetical protein
LGEQKRQRKSIFEYKLREETMEEDIVKINMTRSNVIYFFDERRKSS